jgi:hypothetical protein
LSPKDVRRGIECGLAGEASPSPAIEDSTPTAKSPHPNPLPMGEGTELPPLPPPLIPLPPGAVATGTLDAPCRCGSTEYADIAISGGRTRRDCRKCGRFLGFGQWHEHGGSTQ